jgi:histidine ammonia-lyase
MGWSAARKLRRSVDGLARVLAVEVLTASRGIQLRAPLAPAPATGAVVDALVSAGASRPGGDRWLSPEIDVAYGLVVDGTVRRAAESETGPLH